MSIAGPIIDDLRDESDALDALVAPLSAEGWTQPTPAPGWTVAHQIAHLWWTDRAALASITDEAAFGEMLTAAAADPLGFVDKATEALTAATPPDDLRDGLRWSRPDGFVHVRASGTEPIVRVVVEAGAEETARAAMDGIRRILHQG